jgi:hypothetical protein
VKLFATPLYAISERCPSVWSEANPDRTVAIQQITALAQALHEALESQNTGQILVAQLDLLALADKTWAKLKNDTTIIGRKKTILRILAGGAIKELPEKIKDPANDAQIKLELHLVKSSAGLM